MQIKKLILAIALSGGFQGIYAAEQLVNSNPSQAIAEIDPTPEAIPDKLNLNVDAGKTKRNKANLTDDSASLDKLLNPVSKATTGVTDLRAELIESAAQTVGFQNGLASEANILLKSLNSRASQLDNIYQFNTLVQTNGVLPPVIVEAQNLSAFSDDQIRTANHVYKIEREERFVSVPPTWRDYLYLGLIGQKPGEIVAGTKPENKSELKIWRGAVQKGWKEGQAQAAEILKANFNRLTRDYTGMMLYSTLRQQHMINSTQVAELTTTVRGDSQQLLLGDKHKRIVGKARFETNANNWKPVLNRSSDQDQGKVVDQTLIQSNVTRPAN